MPQYPAPLRTETKVTGTKMQVRILSGAPFSTKELIMNIKTFMALAVVALTAACAPTAETLSITEAAGPAADEALAAANAVVATPKADSK